MDNITMSLGIYFEVKDAEIYGGEGTVGYAATIVDISLSGLQKADFKKYAESQKEGMAQFCHVPVEKVRVISIVYDYQSMADELNRLAGLVNLPPSIEAERKKLNEVMAAVDRERMNPKPEPLIPPPVKVSPFTHQVRGYNMALMTFGLVDPPKPKEAEK